MTTRPQSWRELIDQARSGRRVGLWGAGVEGEANLRRLRVDGIEPDVVADKASTLDDGTPVLAFDDAGASRLAACDVVIKSPGISPYSPAAKRVTADGAVIVGGLGLWLGDTDRSKVACLTGTKGKSTTTSIAAGLLAGLGARYGIGGNIGFPPWCPDRAEESADVDWWVIETSSYQVLDIHLGPAVVGVTSLGEDHLPWHAGSVETYWRDKLSLCTKPGVRQVVANGNDPLLRAQSAQLGEHIDWVDAPAAQWAASGKLLGEHNRRNAEIARRVLVALGVPGADDPSRLAEAFAAFEPLPHRLTPVAELDGVVFVDDSISTNVLSADAAVASFTGRKVALLVGGLERDIDYTPLADTVRRGDVKVFTMPSNGPAIAKVLHECGVDQVSECETLADAVRAGFDWARPGGVVLLSPAAASFDLFANYQARGDAFAAAARAIAP